MDETNEITEFHPSIPCRNPVSHCGTHDINSAWRTRRACYSVQSQRVWPNPYAQPLNPCRLLVMFLLILCRYVYNL